MADRRLGHIRIPAVLVKLPTCARSQKPAGGGGPIKGIACTLFMIMLKNNHRVHVIFRACDAVRRYLIGHGNTGANQAHNFRATPVPTGTFRLGYVL